LAALDTLRAPVGSPLDKARVALLAARDGVLPARRLLAQPEQSTYDALRSRGLSDSVIDRFLRPFLSGVFLEDDLATSSRFFDLVWRTFARGSVCVPAGGMQQIPAQLAADLPADTVRTGVPVRAVEPGQVHTRGGELLRARAVLVATDPFTASRLLPAVPAPVMIGVTTYYHAAPEPPVTAPILVLDGERRGRLANSVVLSNAAPGYSPDGRALVSTSVLDADGPDEPAVRRELERLYGVDVADWEHIDSVRVPAAVPRATPPLGSLRRPVALGDGLYVAGDHRDTPSIQGAMESGRRAAAAVLREWAGGARR
jgi:protoporphyrinogen oxidase